MKKVLVVGEILIDLVEGKDGFKASIGGAPFNVAYNLSCLGDDVTFVGQVGDDYFGNLILNSLKGKKNLNLNIEKLNERNTTIALNVDDSGKRKYSFIRKNTADYAFNLEKINSLDISKFNLIHIGSLFLSNVDSRKVISVLIERAKKLNIPVSFDVNLRTDIFDENTNILNIYNSFIESADLIKFSDEETPFFFNGLSQREIFNKINAKCLLITEGSKGSSLITKEAIITHTSFKVKVKDTVGAGDSFYSGFLHAYLNLDDVNNQNLNGVLEFASACGALTCLKDGAINGYKSEKDVYKFINDRAITKKDFLFFNFNK